MEHAVYTQFYESEDIHWWFQGMRAVCREILKALPMARDEAVGRCLDIGCGTGGWTKELKNYGSVFGVDIHSEALKFSRQRGNKSLVRASAEAIPFKPKSYPLITGLGIIEHLDNDRQFLAELYRICAPGGYVLLLTSAYQFLWSQHDDIVHHKRRYTRRQLDVLVQSAGFEAIKVSYVNAVLFPWILLIRLFQRLRRKGVSVAETKAPDLFLPPRSINELLVALLALEGKLLGHIILPFGVGLIAVVKKPDSEQQSKTQPSQLEAHEGKGLE